MDREEGNRKKKEEEKNVNAFSFADKEGCVRSFFLFFFFA